MKRVSTYKTFINEGIRDMMTPASKEDIKQRILASMGHFDLNKLVRQRMTDIFSFEEIYQMFLNLDGEKKHEFFYNISGEYRNDELMKSIIMSLPAGQRYIKMNFYKSSRLFTPTEIEQFKKDVREKVMNLPKDERYSYAMYDCGRHLFSVAEMEQFVIDTTIAIRTHLLSNIIRGIGSSLNENPKIIETIFKAPIDCDYRDSDGETLLMVALKKRYFNVVRELVRRGADLNTQRRYSGSWEKDTPLTYACRTGNFEIFKLLVDSGAEGINAGFNFFAACCSGSIDIVKYFIENTDVYINTMDRYGSTALVCAYQNGHKPLVEYLRKNGAKVNCTDHNGNSSLILAVRDSNKSRVETLIDMAIDVNIRNDAGKTALSYADYQTRHILIKNGAEV